MVDRLGKLLLVSPPSDTPWCGPPPKWQHPVMQRRDGQSIPIDLPLFWYDPPWYQLLMDRAVALATAVAQQGILVSALRSDLAPPDGVSLFHGDPVDSAPTQDRAPQPLSLPRLVPYRPERYGFADRDFDGATVIDVRLTMHRDDSGRFAYSALQLERWEGTTSGNPVSGGSWVPSATFPPDVFSLKQLGVKLDQLRVLSPTAAIFVSISAWRLDNEIPAVIGCQPDGLILRLDEVASDGLELAALTRCARRLTVEAGAPDLPLWIVPGSISPDDAVKLIALGASAVAIDSWCSGLWEAACGQDRSPAARLGYGNRPGVSSSYWSQVAAQELKPRVERVIGMLHSIQASPPGERLTSLSRSWREQLQLPGHLVPKGLR